MWTKKAVTHVRRTNFFLTMTVFYILLNLLIENSMHIYSGLKHIWLMRKLAILGIISVIRICVVHQQSDVTSSQLCSLSIKSLIKVGFQYSIGREKPVALCDIRLCFWVLIFSWSPLALLNPSFPLCIFRHFFFSSQIWNRGLCSCLILSRVKIWDFFPQGTLNEKTFNKQIRRVVSSSQSLSPHKVSSHKPCFCLDTYTGKIYKDIGVKQVWWLPPYHSYIHHYAATMPGREGYTSVDGSWFIQADQRDHFRASGLSQSAYGLAMATYELYPKSASWIWRKEHFSCLKLGHICPTAYKQETMQPWSI